MKYTYINATGKTEINVDERFHDLLVAMDREEYNAERKHSRRYPISMEDCEYEGEWFADDADPLGEAETAIDMGSVLATLTRLQQFCFVEVKLNGRGYREVAAELGRSRSVVEKAVKGAVEKLKKYF